MTTASFTITLSDQGTLEVPEEIREALGVRAGESVTFELNNGRVALKRRRMTIDEAFGSVQAMPGDIDEAIREAKEERAARYVEKMRNGNA